MRKIIILLALAFSFFSQPLFAEDFIIKNIEVQGLQRTSEDTVISYLPVHVGDRLTSEKTAEIIASLYKTGFFEHISLSRRGNTLVIKVIDRPTIGKLTITGNSAVATDKLTSVMKSVNIAEGRVYDRAMLDKIRQSLLAQYYQLGRYNARVDVTVTPAERNRVNIHIAISEGLVAKIRRINIIGNRAFTEKELDRQLDISTPNLFTFITQKDRYSQERIEASLDNLRNYYLDHGYIKFAIKSSQVSITPDRKSVYLTVVIDEGEPYTVNGITFSDNAILTQSEMHALSHITPGQTFSRQAVINTEKSITEALGNKGYAFAEVSLAPEINDHSKTIFLHFNIKPGKRVYVRHIFFTDNSKTNDEVLRREVEQMEASVLSTSKLDESKHKLGMLPYLKDVQMEVKPVENTNDQVDVNYKVTEQNAAEATARLGYSQKDGIILGAGFNQKNFMGTGNTFGLNVSKSRPELFLGFNYTNPYYTPDGISRTINLAISRFDPRRANTSASYTQNEYDASVIYGIPLGQEKDVFNRMNLGYGYANTLIRTTNPVSQQVSTFVNKHGRHFQQLDLSAGFSRDSRDKTIFPTRGMIHNVNLDVFLPLASSSLKYYALSYNTKWYRPITNSFIFTIRGNFAYGSAFDGAENYPFFKNFYAGGFDSVRGFEANTLGPKDSLGNPTGGNALVAGSLGLIFPNNISDNLRTSVFMDGGNVYNTFNNRKVAGSASGPPRYSVGLEADYLSFLGMIDLSVAKPLNFDHATGKTCGPNKTCGDSLEIFQFSLGANFG